MRHQQLKEYTASSHAALEKELVNWIRSIKTTADYVVFLRIEALRADSRSSDIPAVIYSTYHDSSFVKSCQDLNIELLLKPDIFDDFSQLIRDLVYRHIGS